MSQTTPDSSIPFSSSWLRVPVMAEERAAKRRRYTSDIITLKVGEKKEALSIHENKLGEDSAFFPAALKESWAEGQTGEIELPDDDFDVVAFYVDWLYSKQIIGCIDDEGAADYITLAKLFVFGEKMQSEEFKKEVLRTMIKGMDQRDIQNKIWVPGPPAIDIIYDGTPPSSPARALVVDDYVQQAVTTWFKEDRYDNVEFLLDLSAAFVRELRHTEAKPFWDRRELWLGWGCS